MAVGKTKIVGELAGASLLLPQLVAQALAANARIKFALSWLQMAEASAQGDSHASFAVLEPERRLAGLDGDPLYAPPAITAAADGICLPHAAAILARIGDDLARMRAAIQAGAEVGILGAPVAAGFLAREEAFGPALTLAADLLPNGLVSALSRPPREGTDSLHGLVMDMHKALNAITMGLAEENIDGAWGYRLQPQDKARVMAFMRGLNRTTPLKFDHPGLDANAMRDGDRLVNDTRSVSFAFFTTR